MRDLDLSRLASGLGRVVGGVATGGLSELARSQAIKKREEEQQQRQQLGNILADQSIPQFLRPGGAEALSPEELERTQLQQLSALGTPEALEIVRQRSPLTRTPQAPLSPIGKIQADIEAGKITPQAGRAAIQRQTQPRAPLVQVSPGQTGFEKKVGELAGADLIERRTGALQAKDSLLASQQALNLLNSGIITGFGADFKVGLGKALQTAGFNIAENEIANTEAFVGQRAQEVGRIIQLFGAGTGLSDADRDFAQKAAAGKISLTEKSIRKLLQINDKASRNVIKNFNVDAGKISRDIVPFDLSVDLPTTAGDLTTLSTEELLKRLQ